MLLPSGVSSELRVRGRTITIIENVLMRNPSITALSAALDGPFAATVQADGAGRVSWITRTGGKPTTS